MSRLIDADKLIEELKIKTVSKDAHIIYIANAVVNLVNSQPTAFDTENVVEQLMIIHNEGYCPNEDGLECVLDKACSDCYREKVIDIVKKGWVK